MAWGGQAFDWPSEAKPTPWVQICLACKVRWLRWRGYGAAMLSDPPGVIRASRLPIRRPTRCPVAPVGEQLSKEFT